MSAVSYRRELILILIESGSDQIVIILPQLRPRVAIPVKMINQGELNPLIYHWLKPLSKPAIVFNYNENINTLAP